MTALRHLLVASLSAAVLAACGTTPSAQPSGPESAAPTNASQTPALTPVTTVSPTLPPAPDGQTVAAGQPLLTVSWAGDVTGPGGILPQVALYPDGSLLDRSAAGDEGVPTVRRLTGVGRDTLLDAARASQLFTRTRSIAPAGRIASGFTTYTVTLRVDERTVSVSAGNAAMSDEGRLLVDLAVRLAAPTDWLPVDAWVDGDSTPLPYRPATERLTVEVIPVPPGPGWRRPSVTLESLPWPFEPSPDALGTPLPIPGEPGRTVRCMLIDGDLGARLRLAFRTRAIAQTSGQWATWWAPGQAMVGLTLRPSLPEEEASCDPAGVPEPLAVEAVPLDAVDILEAALHGGIAADGPVVLAVELFRSAVGGGPIARLYYLATGAVVVEAASDPATVLGVLRLTPAGLAAVLGLADETGLLATSADYSADAGSTDVTVATIRRSCDPDCGAVAEVRANSVAPSVKAIATMDLARRLADPASLLPASAFVAGDATVRPWDPGRALLIAGALSVPTDLGDPAALRASLPPEAAVVLPGGERLSTIGRETTFSRWPDDPEPRSMRCLAMATAATRAAAAALEAVGADRHRNPIVGPGSGDLRAAWELRGERPGTIVVVEILLPDPREPDLPFGCGMSDPGFGW